MAKVSTTRPNKKQKAEVEEKKVVLPDPISSDEEEIDLNEEEEELEDEEEAELEEESDEADQDNEDDEEDQQGEELSGESGEEEEVEEEEEEEEEEFKSSLSFSQLGLASWLVNALKAMSITSPSEIQTKCIPKILAGKDVIGGAKTGSGKTAAFALPILQKLSEDPYGVFAVVLTPTR